MSRIDERALRRAERERLRQKKLNPMQQVALPAICEKWRQIALCTTPAKRSEAERGAVELYTANGLNPPQEFIWFKSLSESAEIHGSGCDFQPFGKPWLCLSWGPREVAWKSAMRCFKGPVLHDVQNLTRRFSDLPFGPYAILRMSGQAPSHGHQPPCCFGQFDAEWLAFADFFENAGGVKYRAPLSPLMRIVASCGLFWPGEGKVAFFERPNLIRHDDRMRLHCLDGPALQYPDGTTIYAIHGVSVPAKYISTPAAEINLADVLQEQNVEVRMAIITKVGFDRLLQAAQPRPRGVPQTCPKCGEHFFAEVSRRVKKIVPEETRGPEVVVVSQANGNSLLEIGIGKREWHRDNFIRFLHLKWQDKFGAKETVIPVPRRRREFGEDCPENINDCEQVRRWTLGWPKEAMAVAET